VATLDLAAAKHRAALVSLRIDARIGGGWSKCPDGYTRAARPVRAAAPAPPATSAVAVEQADKQAILDVIAVEPRRFPRLYGGLREPDVVFVSKTGQQGWQGTLDHYVRDYGGSPGAASPFFDIRSKRGNCQPLHIGTPIGTQDG
jgi:hypothetical protein